MAITLNDVAALEAALMRGEREVEYEGRRVVFRSVDEIRQALSYAKSQLASASGPQRTSYAEFARD